MSEICELQVHNNTSTIQDRQDRSFINYDYSERTFGQHLPLCCPDVSQEIAKIQPTHCFREKNPNQTEIKPKPTKTNKERKTNNFNVSKAILLKDLANCHNSKKEPRNQTVNNVTIQQDGSWWSLQEWQSQYYLSSERGVGNNRSFQLQ